jgi:peptide/nickel transport system permease protein
MKIFNILITLFGVLTVIFFLFQVLPGDPARMMMDQNENEYQIEIINQKYGFDLPVFKQYLYYLNDLSIFSVYSKNELDFNFFYENKFKHKKLFETKNKYYVLKLPYLRESYQRRGVKVSTIISNTFPNTVVLAVSSILIAIISGIILGIFSALNNGSFLDHFIQFISTLGMSVPSFFSAIIFAWIFGFLLSDFTGLNMTGSLYELDDYGNEYNLKLKNLILPSLVLGIRPIAVISMMMRNSMIEVLKKDYVITAYAKGLTTFQVIYRHCLKNSLNPVVTALSGWFASLLAGSVFVEYIFGWNGLGREIVNSLNNLDVPVVIGAVLTVSFSFILINIFVDEIYKILDPRIK